MKIELPYGSKMLQTEIQDDQQVKIIAIQEQKHSIDIEEHLIKALRQPLDASPLQSLVSSNNTVAIVIDDYTRPCPSKKILIPLLDELDRLGIKETDIKIIIATGTHKPPSVEMMKTLVGSEIFRKYTVTSNDSNNSTYVNVGTSSFGHSIEILKDYVEADIKILIGDIEYHYFAGFGGTRKSVLPGIASAMTIQNNHSMMFEETVSKGKIDTNPVSIEMTDALDMAGCSLAISVVMNSSHDIVGLWCGNPKSVMKKGMELVDQMYKKTLSSRPDIIIIASDGHPHDINLYQALKALYTASQVIAENGAIILIAACPDGMGNDRYIRWMEAYSSAPEIKEALTEDFKIGAHKAFYHRNTIEQNQVILLSEMNASYVKDHLGFTPTDTLEHAVMKAKGMVKEQPEIIIVPQGSTTHLVLDSSD